MKADERMVLDYIVNQVLEDLAYDPESEQYRDMGGIIISLSEEEYQTLKNVRL